MEQDENGNDEREAPNEEDISEERRRELSSFADELGLSEERVVEEYLAAFSYVPHEDAKAAVKSSMFESQEDFYSKKAKGNLRGESSGGSSTQAPLIMIGHGRRTEWSRQDESGSREVLFANGLLLSDSNPAGLASIVFDSDDGVDLDWLEDEVCKPFTPVEGNFSINDAETVSGAYTLYSTTGMSLQVGDVDSLPEDEYDRLELVSDHVDSVSMDVLGDRGTMSATETYSSGGQTRTSAADFGVDLKCIPAASIVDLYADIKEREGESDYPWAVYTVMDDTMTKDDLLESEIVDPDGDENRQNGLSVWCEHSHMKHGKGAMCNFYGVVESDNGQIQMNLRGVFPISDEPVQSDQVIDVTGSTTGETETF